MTTCPEIRRIVSQVHDFLLGKPEYDTDLSFDEEFLLQVECGVCISLFTVFQAQPIDQKYGAGRILELLQEGDDGTCASDS